MIRHVILFALASTLGALLLAAPARADGKADLAAAIEAEESRDHDKALRLYGRALAAKDLDKEGRARAHFGRANILVHIKRHWTAAIRELDTLIRLRPDYRGALRMRAKAYRKRAYDTLSTKDLDRSLADLERISRKSIQLNFKPPIGAFVYCNQGCERGLIACRRDCAVESRKGVCGQVGACRRRDFRKCSGFCLRTAGACGTWCLNYQRKHRRK